MTKPPNSAPSPKLSDPIESAAPLGTSARGAVWYRRLGYAWSVFAPRLSGLNPWLLLLIPAYYVVTMHLLRGRYPLTHSFAPNVIWGYEWTEQVRTGILYPRWMEHTFGGLGSPTFHFYGPLAFFMMMPFTVGLKLTVTQGILMTSTLALGVMGLGVARLATEIGSPKRRWLPAIAGSLAMLSPYALLDVYIRGAMAEAWAMALFPWVLGTLLRSLDSRDPKSRFALVVATALLGVAHPAIFLISVITIGACLLMTASGWQDVAVITRRVFLPISVAIALDGFYLVPAIFDQKYAQIDLLNENNTGVPTYRMLAYEFGHFSTKFAEGFEGDMVPGFLAGATAALCAALLLWRRGHPDGPRRRRGVLFLMAIALLCALMLTDLGRGVYELFPVFNRLQFAWRWLTLFTTVTAALWAYVLLVAVDRSAPGRGLLRIFAWVTTLWMATHSLWYIERQIDWNSKPRQEVEAVLAKLRQTNALGDPTASPKEINGGLLFVDAHGDAVFNDVREYLPPGRILGMPPRRFQAVEWGAGAGDVSNLQWNYQWRRFDVNSAAGGRLLVRTNAWPGWEVEVNGVKVAGDRAGENGRIALAVPAGQSKVTVRYVGTLNQHLGGWLSWATLIGLIGAFSWMKRVGDRRLEWGV